MPTINVALHFQTELGKTKLDWEVTEVMQKEGLCDHTGKALLQPIQYHETILILTL